ncbi:MAG: hypothetical protein A2V86_01760 [Deltaproteobacteria bacterium RBG_16_49_23]|mgnify:CR=1 FL=1|nr:MAG: hypothetical protein A2V86_01760 [Deltaproteobacteria bacterium RBG_16_49_23]
MPKTRLGKANAANQKANASGKPVGGTKASCPLKDYKLVKLTVIQNATQNHVTGAKNWAAIKKATGHVIVEATTSPNTEDAWKKIKWSGDAGTLVKGKLNQRRLSRKNSKKYHVEAELGGVKDYVDVWVLWATITILTKDTDKIPKNSAKFHHKYDGTEKLGVRYYNNGNAAAGKVAPFAIITPKGVHEVVKSGWEFKRECFARVWKGGKKFRPGDGPDDYWNTKWVHENDTSRPRFLKLIPDSEDKIYDIDGPNIEGKTTYDVEIYYNFRQWIEWKEGTDGKFCSAYAPWYFKGHWRSVVRDPPKVTMVDVGKGNTKLPDRSYFHPSSEG